MLKEVIAPEYIGSDEPKIVLVCWGSSFGSTLEATQVLIKQGLKAGMLFFKQVYPLRGDQFMPLLKSASKVVGVEGNATGQFVALIRKETGFYIKV